MSSLESDKEDLIRKRGIILNEKTALLVGATGLIGNELVQILLQSENYKEVIVVGRRTLHLNHPKLTEVLVDFEKLVDYTDRLAADDVFCCLGTTIKKAKSKEAMYTVDVTYPIKIANLAHLSGAKQFLVISAMNANLNSVFSYSKMKGELEQKLAVIPYASTAILRPSLLLGERSEFRLGERVGAVVCNTIPFIFKGPLKKYAAIEGRDVALAMYHIAQLNKQGLTIYQSEQLHAFSK